MNKSIFLLAFISLYVLMASAKSELKCKVCGSNNGIGTCRNEDEGKEKECDDEHNSCYKKVRENGMIDRGCSKINKDHCEEEETLRGKKITTCWCKDDLCNGSQINKMSRNAVFICGILATIVSRFV